MKGFMLARVLLCAVASLGCACCPVGAVVTAVAGDDCCSGCPASDEREAPACCDTHNALEIQAATGSVDVAARFAPALASVAVHDAQPPAKVLLRRSRDGPPARIASQLAHFLQDPAIAPPARTA